MLNIRLHTSNKYLNPLHPDFTFNRETSRLVCAVKQMTGFYTKYNNGLKWFKFIFRHLRKGNKNQLICYFEKAFPPYLPAYRQCYSIQQVLVR